MIPTQGVASQEFSGFWFGERLLPLTNACFNSFNRHGHQFNLYTYDAVGYVPAFVKRQNADAIIPRGKVFKAHGGWETFADQFAYQFLSKVGGWWVDSDVVCNADIVPDVEIAFAEEQVGVVNNAVLKFPKGHPVIGNLLEYVATVDPINSKWGSTGPLALTRIFNQHGLMDRRRQMSEFYPLHWKEAPKLLFPEFTGEVLAKIEQAPFLHMWGSTLKEIGFDLENGLPLEGSYLNMLYSKCLDPHIHATLRPMDEGEFRKAVREYVAETPHWRIDLPL